MIPSKKIFFPQAPVSIYVLECAEGIGANLAKGSDLVTNNLNNDWTGKHAKLSPAIIDKSGTIFFLFTCSIH